MNAHNTQQSVYLFNLSGHIWVQTPFWLMVDFFIKSTCIKTHALT